MYFFTRTQAADEVTSITGHHASGENEERKPTVPPITAASILSWSASNHLTTSWTKFGLVSGVFVLTAMLVWSISTAAYNSCQEPVAMVTVE